MSILNEPEREIGLGFTETRDVSGSESHSLVEVLEQSTEKSTELMERGGRPSVKELLLPLFLMAGQSSRIKAESLGEWTCEAHHVWLPRFVFQRTKIIKHRIRLGIFAGIHGDEPAGILALMDLVRDLEENPELGKDFLISLYPLCNPTGYLDGTRESRSGLDLNREFWQGSSEKEVKILEKELLKQDFDGIISLHSDDTSDGFYGFARRDVLATELLKPALKAAHDALAVNSDPVIDGFHAVNGIIHSCYDGILSAPPAQKPQPFEIILETPALKPLKDQRLAFRYALHAIIGEYRKFIAYAADL